MKLPSFNAQGPIAARRKGGVVGDQNEGGLGFGVQRKQQISDALARGLIQIARGLIREKKLGLGGEGPRQGHPLLLPPGELARRMAGSIPQAYPLQIASGQRLGSLPSGQFQGDHDVLQGREGCKELKVLKDKGDTFGPERRPAILRFRTKGLACKADLPFRGRIEARQQAQERGFPRTGGPDQGNAIPRLDLKIDPRKDGKLFTAKRQALA